MTRSFSLYIHRIVKTMNENMQITKKTVCVLNTLLIEIQKKISKYITSLLLSSSRKTIGVKEIETSVRILFPSELSKELVSHGENVLSNFLNWERENIDGPVSRNTKAGLIVSVSLTEQYMRKFDQSHSNIGKHSPIFLSAILEKINKNIIKKAIDICRDDKKTTINVRHVYLSISNNRDWRNLVTDLNINIPGSGIVPFIHPSLDTNGEEKKNANSSKNLPGIVAVEKIKIIQKDGRLLIQKSPFARMVRDITKQWCKIPRFTPEFMSNFQSLVENDIVKIVESANKLVIYCNRETLTPSDITMSMHMKNHSITKHNRYTDVKTDIPGAGIRKIIHRGGVKRLSNGSIACVKNVFFRHVSNLMYVLYQCLLYDCSKTFGVKLLVNSFGLIDRPIAIQYDAKKRMKHTETSVETSEEEEKGERVRVSVSVGL